MKRLVSTDMVCCLLLVVGVLSLTGCAGETAAPSGTLSPLPTRAPAAELTPRPVTPAPRTVTPRPAASAPAASPLPARALPPPAAAPPVPATAADALAEAAITLVEVARGFVSPVGLIPSPDATGRLFIVDQAGTIQALTADGSVLDQPFLDLRNKMVELTANFDERGLLGLAFHPAYQQNGRFFVYYSAPLRPEGPPGWNHTSHISEFRVSASDPNRADPGSERIILRVDEPQFNHNGGQITFGPDGFLYIPLGDGGGANDVGLGHSPGGNGQDTSTLLGKILRIDVDSGDPYGIPPDNPFVGGGGRPEIFAFGFRNPFRISFDSGGANELFAGDAGQRLWEEVDLVAKGGNYGWNIKEGAHCFDPANPSASPPQCPDVDTAGRALIDPIVEYQNVAAGGIGTAVIGGFVYRGSALPALNGMYLFGDFSGSLSGPEPRLFLAVRPDVSGGKWTMQGLPVKLPEDFPAATFIRSFGQDLQGEIYVLTADPRGPVGQTGRILRIAPASAVAPSAARSPTPVLSPPAPSGTVGTPVPSTVQVLAASGRTVFASRCARCHGPQGQGAFGPPIIGSNATLEKFNTAKGLYDFISVAMPFDAPGSLSRDEYLQVLSFLVVENKLVRPASGLEAGRLEGLVLKKQ